MTGNPHDVPEKTSLSLNQIPRLLFMQNNVHKKIVQYLYYIREFVQNKICQPIPLPRFCSVQNNVQTTMVEYIY
jgi:hypothetical protein